MIENVDKCTNGNSTRYIFYLSDGSIVEMAVFNHNGQIHLCVSTQVGCPVGCRHCATTYAFVPYQRNLKQEELSSMIEYALNQLKAKGELVLSFSGHGEPSLNWETVKAIKASFQHKFHRFYVTTIGKRDILRTVIESKETDFTYYLSLHGTTDAERSILIPNSSLFATVRELFQFIYSYSARGGKTVVNYMLHKGNCSAECLDRLIQLLYEANQNVTLRFTDYNSIEYNTGIIGLNREEKVQVMSYFASKIGAKTLWNYHYSHLEGNDIQIACDQLRAGMIAKGDLYGSVPPT